MNGSSWRDHSREVIDKLTRRLLELGVGDGLIDPTGRGLLTLREPEGAA